MTTPRAVIPRHLAQGLGGATCGDGLSLIPRIFREPRQGAAFGGTLLHMIESGRTEKLLVSGHSC
jgi:hypothetical protein